MTLLTVILAALLIAPAAHAKLDAKRANTVKALNDGLAGTPMRHTGRQLEAAGWKYGVNPALLAAIAGVESSYGAAHCSQSRFWVFGLGSCARSWTPPYFRSWWQTYDYQARFVRVRWLSRGVKDPWTMGNTYCPPCGSSWGDKIALHIRRFRGMSLRLAYGYSESAA